MPSPARVIVLTCALLLGAVAGAAAQGPYVPYADSLRPEWTVESTRAGRPQVVGYLHNSNIKDAANVWLRVDQLGADGAVAARALDQGTLTLDPPGLTVVVADLFG